jgi:hypothetical protein
MKLFDRYDIVFERISSPTSIGYLTRDQIVTADRIRVSENIDRNQRTVVLCSFLLLLYVLCVYNISRTLLKTG